MKIIFYRFLTVLFLLTFLGAPAYSQIKISEEIHKTKAAQQKKSVTYKKIDSKDYLSKMSLAKKTIKEELEQTDDKAKRNELIKKLYQIDNAYYNDSIRTEMIRKTRPGYAARVEAYRTLTPKQRQIKLMEAELKQIEIQPQIRGTIESRWNNIQAWEKRFHCAQSAKECFAGSNLKCRFVLDKCYEYIDRQTFKKVRARFATSVN